jgi:beta-mannosidase
MRDLDTPSPLLLAADEARALATGWSLAATPPNAAAEPRELDALGLRWIDAVVPGTVAQALAAAAAWTLDAARDFDAEDWWYRCRFTATAPLTSRARLELDGLATHAEVWLNDSRILESSNMFLRYAVDVTELLSADNVLCICFRSLTAALARRRPRPRWKTKLVAHQQLRWWRTTLLGRIPGWSPPVAAVGPYRAIRLSVEREGTVRDITVRTAIDGSDGVLSFEGTVAADPAAAIEAAASVGGVTAPVQVQREGNAWRVHGTVRVDKPALWWPHTHGEPALHSCALVLKIDGDEQSIDCGSVGFRSLECRDSGGDFALRINGTEIFCRGACWTVNDIVSLDGDPEDLRRTLTALRDAGANMLRIGGTMLYEQTALYEICDRLGIMVWQDFMFANMDYPADDPGFADSVREEATQQVRRLAAHPSVVVFCGNSEVEQQAAMLGMPRHVWRNTLFADLLPSICRTHHPGAAYVASTPNGAGLPFQTGDGLTHYYGVGAYLRPITDVRRAAVRFTPECLGFANVPEPEVVDAVMQGEAPAPHDPRWKRRTPRDSGAGWDFEDVRDHYVRELFAVDPSAVRARDSRRYLALGRVATGEMMAQTFAEWRRPGSGCRGALVWFAKDLWPGAGWGILDSRGVPKACFYAVRRAWQPRAVVLTDEGLNGVAAHVINERSEALAGALEITLLRDSHTIVAQGRVECAIEPRGAASFGADAILGGFYDTAYAYRFGPPPFDVLVATLYGPDGILGEAFHFPVPGEPRPVAVTAVRATARRVDGSRWVVSVTSDEFLFAAHLDVAGFQPDDDYSHIVPGRPKHIRLRCRAASAPVLRGFVEALNLAEPVRLDVE